MKFMDMNISLTSVFLWTIVAILSYNLTLTLYIRFFHLGDIPGPSTAAYTRLWLSRTIGSGHSHEIFTDVNKKYGSSILRRTKCYMAD